MKTISKIICVLVPIALVSCYRPASAQEADETKLTPPPRPYVGELKGDYSLVEKLTHKPHPAPAPGSAPAGAPEETKTGPDLVEFDSVETGTVRKDKQVLADGTSSEIWRSNALRFILRPENPNQVVVASYQMTDYKDPSDFEELKWVGAGFYKGEQTIGDRACYFYKQGEQSAWIEKSTRHPVLYDSPALHITYTFSTPDAPLQLPANISQKLQQMRRAWAGLPAN